MQIGLASFIVLLGVKYYHSGINFDNNLLLVFLGVCVGCLLPDIDHQNSIIGSLTPFHYVMKHGGITHTLLVNCVIFLIWILTMYPFLLGLGIGYITHLIGDNLQGNKLEYLYYPFKRRKKKKYKGKKGGK